MAAITNAEARKSSMLQCAIPIWNHLMDLANIGNGNRLSSGFTLTINQNMIKVVEMALSISSARRGKRRWLQKFIAINGSLQCELLAFYCKIKKCFDNSRLPVCFPFAMPATKKFQEILNPVWKALAILIIGCRLLYWAPHPSDHMIMCFMLGCLDLKWWTKVWIKTFTALLSWRRSSDIAMIESLLTAESELKIATIECTVTRFLE